MRDYVHLHNHSDYSLLDGAVKIPWYIERCKKLGMKHIALTDHGALFGALRFEQACHAAGINPIVGCEVYVAPNSRFERAVSKDNYRNHHMLLFCKNETGYKNLVKLVSRAYTEGYYYKPRIDDEILAENSAGLMASTACLGGEIPRLLIAGKLDEAEERALFYNDLFGAGNFWLEIMNHGDKDEQLNKERMIELSKNTGIQLIATNDIHYLNKEHAEAHEILMAIGHNKTLSDSKRHSHRHSELYFKTVEEMNELFADIPEALENTVRLAEKCDLHIPQPGPILPSYEIPDSYPSKEEYFRDLVWAGVKKRYQATSITAEIQKRVDYEIKVISDSHYVGYFLIVWDFIDWARKRNISVGPGRGSGAGSIVAYALGITDVEPLKYGLLFERFLNTERVSMPDFDIDFCFERRSEVINYVTEKYGVDRVAGICTFGTLKTKAALKDVARVLEIPFNEANLITSLVPNEMKMTVKKALEQESKLKEFYDRGGLYKKLFDIARTLEGMNRHVSTHACGMVIGQQAITDYVPLYKDTKTKSISTQFTMDLIEDCGLVKMDFLGLKTLTLLDRIGKLICKREADFNLENIPDDDAKTFKMLSKGESSAVFQFESDGMQKVLRQAQPDSIEDLIALNALYRPGPMQFIQQFVSSKLDPSKIIYPHKDLEETLKPTYGVIVYQEQVMEIARIIGGFSLGKADILRRAMGKKKHSEMKEMRALFISGALEKGYSKHKAEEIFDLLIPFADYGFNKSHAAAYSLLAYQTAYCKANYPVEFMAANLTNEIGNPPSFRKYLNKIMDMDIKLRAPDINFSDKNFTVIDGEIIYGLSGIKGIGSAAVDEILSCRQKHGTFSSFLDFLEKSELKSLNKKGVESLIFAGVFDKIEELNRASLIAGLDRILGIFNKSKQHDSSENLFVDFEDELRVDISIPAQEDFPAQERLEKEKEVLGFYISGHPLDEHRQLWEQSCTLNLLEPARFNRNSKYIFVGLVRQMRVMTTKRNERMLVAEVEDFNGSLDLVVFPKVFVDSEPSFKLGELVAVQGLLEVSELEAKPKLKVSKVFSIDAVPMAEHCALHIALAGTNFQVEELSKLRSYLQKYEGPAPVYLHLRGTNGLAYTIEASPQIGIKPSKELLEQLRSFKDLELSNSWFK